MKKSLLAIAAAFSFFVATSGSAVSGPYYPFGDAPYTLTWGSYPQIEQGCWKWNWQLYEYHDHCPVYLHPKAYMFRGSNVVLRTKG